MNARMNMIMFAAALIVGSAFVIGWSMIADSKNEAAALLDHVLVEAKRGMAAEDMFEELNRLGYKAGREFHLDPGANSLCTLAEPPPSEATPDQVWLHGEGTTISCYDGPESTTVKGTFLRACMAVTPQRTIVAASVNVIKDNRKPSVVNGNSKPAFREVSCQILDLTAVGGNL